MKLRKLIFIIFTFFILGCNLTTLVAPPSETISTQPSAPTAFPTKAEPTPTIHPDVDVDRIGIRTVDGDAQFYNTATGETFIPRGTNYIDFRETSSGRIWEDYIFGAGTYQPEKVRRAFQRLSAGGYNTVRLFFDHCYSGPSCIGKYNGTGLNPVFLDNMVEIMNIAAQENLYLVLTANGVPADGKYWERHDEKFQQNPDGFRNFYENGYYLHAAGVEMQVQYWEDLMSGLAERNAPFNVVLGWQMQNEYWLFKTAPPLSLTEGMVTISNGQSYDMTDEAQKRQMVTDGVLFWMETLIPVIKQHDPNSLITVGFFVSDFPIENNIQTEWYRDTASLIEIAPVDFWDFHAYPEPKTYSERNMQSMAENFGMIGYQEKPVILGEFGAFREIYPDMDTAIFRLQEWVVESCEYGFDGWLTWEYYNRPASDAVWGMELDEYFEALAPANHPDICAITPRQPANLAFGKPVTASNALPNELPENAVDGGNSLWGAGADAPQWIEVDLGEAVTVTKIRLMVAQYPDGPSTHRVQVRSANGVLLDVHTFDQTTIDGQWLEFEPQTPLQDVQAVRITTMKSPSWVAWAEIEVYGE